MDKNTGYPQQQGQGHEGWSGAPPHAQGQQPPPYPGGFTSQPTSRPPIITNRIMVGREPISVNCPNCGQYITTRTTEETGAIAWISAGVMCFVGIWCGCCLIPLCMDSLKDVTHYCPQCNAVVGKFKAMQ